MWWRLVPALCALLLFGSTAGQIEVCDVYDTQAGRCTLNNGGSTYNLGSPITFGNVDKAYGSVAKTVLLVNSQSQEVTVTSITVGQFGANSYYQAFTLDTALPLTIASGGGSSVPVIFSVTPNRLVSLLPNDPKLYLTSPITLESQVVVSYTSGGSSLVRTLKLEGVAVSRSLVVTDEGGTTAVTASTSGGVALDDYVDIGLVDITDQVLQYTLTLGTQGMLEIYGVQLTGGNGAVSIVQGPASSVNIGSTTVVLQFDPSADVAYSAVLSIASNTYNPTASGYPLVPNTYVGITGTGTDVQVRVNITVDGQSHFVQNGDFSGTIANVGGHDISHDPLPIRFTIESIGRTRVTFVAFDTSRSCTGSADPVQVGLLGDDLTDCSGLDVFAFEVTSQTPDAGDTLATTRVGGLPVFLYFDPIVVGSYEVVVTVHTTDYLDGYYSFTVAAQGTDPEIAVYYRGATDVLIPANSFSPTALQGTDFGGLDLNAPQLQHTFVIKNLGTATLDFTDNIIELSGVFVGGAASFGHFDLTLGTFAPSIAAGGEQEFIIAFAPKDNDAPPTANVTIFSQDLDEPHYVFTIEGAITDAEIQFSINRTAFGTVNYDASPGVATVTISNLGSTALLLSGSGYGVSFDPPSPAFFVATGVPSSVAAGGQAQFIVRLAPTAGTAAQFVGEHTVNLVIASNDLDENPVVQALTFVGVHPTMEIEAPYSGGLIIDSQLVNINAHDIDGANQVLFPVTNTGESDLVISGVTFSNTVNFAVSGGFTELVVAPGATEDLVVLFSPTAITSYLTSVTFTTNDYSLAPSYQFTFDITGMGMDIDMTVTYNAVDISSQYTITDSTTLQAASKSYSFTVLSHGSSALRISGISCTGSFTATPASAIGAGLQLSPGQSLAFTVAWSPQNVGSGTSSCTLSSNDPVTQTTGFVINFAWSVIGPEIVVQRFSDSTGSSAVNEIADGSTYAIGKVNIHSTFTVVFRIQNIGNSQLDVTNLSLTGASAFSLACTTSCSSLQSIPGGSSTRISFQATFAPTTTEDFSAVVAIANNDFNEAQFTFTITGTGSDPEIVVLHNSTVVSSGDSLPDFGESQLSSQTVATSLTILNQGTGTLTVSSIALSSGTDFSISATTATLATNASLVLTVSFRASATGARSALLTITSNDLDEGTVTIALSGVGVNRQLGTSSIAAFVSTPDDLGAVSVGGSVTREYTITNVGTTDLMISDVGLELLVFKAAASAGPFSVDDVTGVVAGGASLVVPITFTPTRFGAFEAQVTISTDDFNTPTFAFLVAANATGPEIEVDVGASLFFGTPNVGAPPEFRNVTVSNAGNELLNVTAISIEGDANGEFVGEFGRCITELAPGGACTFGITFTPLVEGEKLVFLRIFSNDGDEQPLVVNLTAISAEPDILIAMTEIGEIVVNETNTVALRVASVGSGVLTIFGLSLEAADTRAKTELAVDPHPTAAIDAAKFFETRTDTSLPCLNVTSVSYNGTEGKVFFFNPDAAAVLDSAWQDQQLSVRNGRTLETVQVVLLEGGIGQPYNDAVLGNGTEGYFQVGDTVCPVGLLPSGEVECLVVDLHDSYADGWGDNHMNIRDCEANVLMSGIRLPVGMASEQRVLCLPASQPGYEVAVGGGAWQGEVSWSVQSTRVNTSGMAGMVVRNCSQTREEESQLYVIHETAIEVQRTSAVGYAFTLALPPNVNTSFPALLVTDILDPQQLDLSVTSDDPDEPVASKTLPFVGIDRRISVVDENERALSAAAGIAFGVYVEQAEVSMSVFVSNGGASSLTIEAVEIVGNNVTWSVPSTSTVLNRQDAPLEVAFTYSAQAVVGTFEADLCILSNDLVLPVLCIPLTATVINPVLERVTGRNGLTINHGDDSPDEADGTNFGAGQINPTVGRLQQFTILSSGETNLVLEPPYVSVVTLDGSANSTDFRVRSLPSTSIAPGAQASFQVEFSPTTLGAKAALVRIHHNEFDSSMYVFRVGGTGTDRVLELSVNTTVIPRDSSFDLVVPLTTVGVQVTTFTIRSTGQSAFVLYGLELDGDTTVCDAEVFDCLVGDQLCTDTSFGSVTLSPNDEVTFVVRFDPVQVSSCDGELRIFFDDDSDSQVFVVDFDGVGFGPLIQVQWASSLTTRILASTTATSNNIGSTDLQNGVATAQFRVFNVGSAGSQLVLQSVTLQQTGSEYSLLGVADEMIVNRGVAWVFTLQFHPSVIQATEAVVTILSSATVYPTFQFKVVGTGTDAQIEVLRNGAVLANGGAVSLGNRDIKGGSQNVSLTVRNSGSTELSVTSLDVASSAGSQWRVLQTVSGALAPGASAVVVLSFELDVVGPHATVVTINSNDFDTSVFTLTLSAEGVDVLLVVTGDDGSVISSGSLAPTSGYQVFETLDINNGTSLKTFHLANHGTTNLVLTTDVWLVGSAPTYDPNSFSLTSQPSRTLLPGENSSFAILFDPITVGTKRILVRIDSNDWASPATVFGLSGLATVDGTPPVVPEAKQEESDGEASPIMIFGFFLAVAGSIVACVFLKRSAETHRRQKGGKAHRVAV